MKKILILIFTVLALGLNAQIFTDVNVGTAAGSGDGDNLRDAFIKVNSNFDIADDSLTAIRADVKDVAGSNTYLQYNDSGEFGASSNLIWSSNILTINGTVLANLFKVNRTLTDLNYHAHDDFTTLNISVTDGVYGYSSFDANPTMNNSVLVSHLNGYQSRLNLTGSGTLTNATGYNAQLAHNGTGTLGTYYAINIPAPTGTGTITNEYAIHIEDFSNGYAIYSQDGDNYFGGELEVGDLLRVDSRSGTAYTDLKSYSSAAAIGFATAPALIMNSNKTATYGYDNSILFRTDGNDMGGIACTYTSYSGGIAGAKLAFYTRTDASTVTEVLKLTDDGNAEFTGDLEVIGETLSNTFSVDGLNTAPASAGVTGTTGEIRYTSTHIYICTATNTWKRVAISTW